MTTESWETAGVEIDSDPALIAFRGEILATFKESLGLAGARVRRGPRPAVVWDDRHGLENELMVSVREPCYNGDRIWTMGVNGRSQRKLDALLERIGNEQQERVVCMSGTRCVVVVQSEALAAAAWFANLLSTRGTNLPAPEPPPSIREKPEWKQLLHPTSHYEHVWTDRAFLAQWKDDPHGRRP